MGIPTNGIWGEVALREAAAGSSQHVMRLIENQLRAALKMSGEKDVWAHVIALFPSQVVVNFGGVLQRYDYTLVGDTAVELKNPVQVVETFKAVEQAAMTEAAQGGFIEAVDAAGARAGTSWKIRVIRAGLSGNNTFYSDAVLREAVPLFNKARVFVKGDEEHLAGKGKDVRNLIGRLSNAVFVEGAKTDAGEIHATFDLLDSADGLAARLREAWGRGMADMFGFSIDAAGAAKTGKIGGRAVRVATKFREVKSVDLIVEPGAGGELIQLIEAKQEDPDMKLRERMLKFVEANRPDLYKTLDTEQPDDDAIEAAYREALKGEAAPAANAPADGITRKDLDDATARAVRLVEARSNALASIDASTLPAIAKDRLKARFREAAEVKADDVKAAIKAETDYLAAFTESGKVQLGEHGQRAHLIEGRDEKTAKMFDAFFDPADRSVISFKEAYIAVTGDKRVTGRLRDCDQALLREAIGSDTFSDVLGDSITRRMIADYNLPSQYDVWRRLATTTPVSDFRTNERTRWGGYGDLPIVAEGDPYAAMSSPTDEKATYAIAKRGGTEEITLETIKNDDVGMVRQLPVKISRAAKRTLAKFVLDFLRTNPAIYDTVALFHADHGNLGAAALSATTLAAGRLAMLKQTEKDSADRLGIGPRDLWVAPDNEETAVDLFRRNTENDKNFVQTLSLNVIPVWYWTDVNDWCLSADPMDVPTIEIGFLDGNEEPELFVQDSPTVGSLFSHDKITYKVRHPYGGNVLDFRGLYKAVVA